MECNKDDAIRAKGLAEKKLLEKDIAGATRFASKAHNLFPGLEGLSQFQEILDVYVASERKVNGEVDWYGIIGVNPLANDETIRSRYKKLALSLHPDRNKCVGADGAFKLLSEAWSFLSDKAKKAAYDQKVSRGKFVVSNPRAGAVKNGSKKAKMSSLKYPATQNNVVKDSDFVQSNQRTFWTSCRKCNVQYEYLIIYLNQNLICPNCKLPFLAKEKPPPVSTKIGNSSGDWTYNNQQHGANKHFKSTSYAKRKFPPSSTAGGAKNISHNVSRKEELAKKRRLNEQSQMPRSVTGEGISGTKGNNFRSLDIHSVLMGLARVKILKKINELSMKGKTITGGENRIMQKDTEEFLSGSTNKVRNITGSLANDKLVQSRISNESLSEIVPALDQPNESSITAVKPGSVTMANEMMATIVPKFYDFDKDRIEESFSENQVWALYDAKDGMPRYYALIHGLISKDPTEVQISWLNFESDRDLSWIKWFNCGFPQTCGDFKVGKREVVKNLISFSHRVKHFKGGKGLIQIYPKKGDVWILYRNWCSEWNELTPDDVIRQFDLVEVLEDYNDEQGVLVVPLLKVAAYKAVFHPNLDPRTIYIIPKEEMFKFSHQVPSHILTSENAKRHLKGCHELDPAALPIEFLEVMREEEEEEEEVETAFKAEDVVMLDEVSAGNGISERAFEAKDIVMVDEVSADNRTSEKAFKAEDVIRLDEVSEGNGTNDNTDCVVIETLGC